MFGLPYIIAPTEAEAQCAYMEMTNLVDGVVTDDSDVFLFGAQSVYKNIFDDRKYVETYFVKVSVPLTYQSIACSFHILSKFIPLIISKALVPLRLYNIFSRILRANMLGTDWSRKFHVVLYCTQPVPT